MITLSILFTHDEELFSKKNQQLNLLNFIEYTYVVHLRCTVLGLERL